jgi:hypothetical protein
MKWSQIRKRDADLKRELQPDLELEEEEKRERGLSAEKARYAAQRAFGNTTLIREQTREAWGLAPFERLFQDLSYAWRQLGRSRGFTLTALCTLALGIENIPVVCLPYWHDPPTSVFLLVRTSRTPDEFAPIIRRDVWDVDSEAAIPMIEMLDTQLVQSVAPERLQSIVLLSFGVAALLLAVLGVYGVLTYSVSLRTPEFGIRVALGSTKSLLIRMVLLEALVPVGGGIGIGLLASFAVTRAIRSLLYERALRIRSRFSPA